MLDLINPKYYFPITGEYRYQVANADIACKLGIPKVKIQQLNLKMVKKVNHTI